MRYFLIVLSLLVASSAFSQQQPTPSQIALQINAAVGNMAQTIEAQAQQIQALRTQLDAASAEIKRLKSESKKDEPK